MQASAGTKQVPYIHRETSSEVTIWSSFHFVRLKKKEGGQQQVKNPLLVLTCRCELLFGLFISSATRGIFCANLGSRNVQPLGCHNQLHAPRCFLIPSLQLKFCPETLLLFHRAEERTRFVQQLFLSPCAPFSFLNVSRKKKSKRCKLQQFLPFNNVEYVY